eukprot:m.368742 g.368742  ORF g.368742 m.368742 type:complete len:77 (-) comp46329_c0_seq1:92-322(-)
MGSYDQGKLDLFIFWYQTSFILLYDRFVLLTLSVLVPFLTKQCACCFACQPFHDKHALLAKSCCSKFAPSTVANPL